MPVSYRLLKKLAFYVNTGNPLKYADKLRDKRLGEYRFRINEYRIIFDMQDGIILVLKVRHRKDIYR